MFRFYWRPAATALFVAGLALALIPPAAKSVQARATIDPNPVATGLNNPRGLAFGPEGALYVAEAGTGGAGPCIVNSNMALVCYGTTGSITRVTLGGTPRKTIVVSGLPSMAGPTGAAALGPHHVDFQGRGNGFVTIGAALDPARRFNDVAHPEFASVGANVGRLVRFQPNGKWSFQEDLSEFEDEANPDGAARDSNPFGLVALPGRQVFTDAGGNSLNAVAANGSISNLAFFPDRPTPPGAPVPAFQAVPTGVTQGPDGAFYVGQLTGFPFLAGAANVYRVPASGGTPTVYASGFTKIIDLAFGSDGSLYVLEISASGGPPPQGGTGALLRVPPGGGPAVTIVSGSELVAPGGIAIGGDGSIYVTNHSVSPGIGTVLKITP